MRESWEPRHEGSDHDENEVIASSLCHWQDANGTETNIKNLLAARTLSSLLTTATLSSFRARGSRRSAISDQPTRAPVYLGDDRPCEDDLGSVSTCEASLFRALVIVHLALDSVVIETVSVFLSFASYPA